MGLNDSYAQTRCQILMMEPLPPLSKVFALVIQEEWQWSINNGILFLLEPLHLGDVDSTSLNAHIGNQAPKVNMSYKLHGYPPRYKPKSKTQSGQAQANQATSMSLRTREP